MLISAFEVALLVVAEIVLWFLIDRHKHLQFYSVLFPYMFNVIHFDRTWYRNKIMIQFMKGSKIMFIGTEILLDGS